MTGKCYAYLNIQYTRHLHDQHEQQIIFDVIQVMLGWSGIMGC